MVDRKELIEAAEKALTDLIKRVNKEKPAPADIEALRQILGKFPHIAKMYGDLSQIAFSQIAESLGERVFREAVRQHGQNMVEEFEYDRASPMEKLVIQQIVLTWLGYHEAEIRWQMVSQKGATIQQGEYWQRRISMAQSRYLRAIETLARVKKLQEKKPNPALNILLRQQLTGK